MPSASATATSHATNYRRRKAAVFQLVLLPQAAARRTVQRMHDPFVIGHEQVACPSMARPADRGNIADQTWRRPAPCRNRRHAPGRPQRRSDVHRRPAKQHDVGNAIKFGSALGQGDCPFPDRRAILQRQRYQLATGIPDKKIAVGKHRRTGTAHRQRRRRPLIDPLAPAVTGIEKEDLIVTTLYRNTIFANHRRGQHFARDPRLPQGLAVVG
jgi:hypothetical protein